MWFQHNNTEMDDVDLTVRYAARVKKPFLTEFFSKISLELQENRCFLKSGRTRVMLL